MNAPVRVRTHTADGKTVEYEAASMADARAGAELETREGRIAAVGKVAARLLASSDPAELFLGSALTAWLETDRGRLERDFLRVIAARSHCTVAHVWRAHRSAQNSETQRSAPTVRSMPDLNQGASKK